MDWPMSWKTIVLFCVALSFLPPASLQQISNLDFKYLGCYADDDTRILRDYNCTQRSVPECPDCSAHRQGNALGTGVGCQNEDGMTVDMCISLCSGNGHTYAGLQSGTECFCGNEDAVYQKLQRNEIMCNQFCAGDSTQTCGGNFWASVYDIRKSCEILDLDQYIIPSEPTMFGSEFVTFNEGQLLTFTCQTGYQLNGQRGATCQEDGTWSPGIPTCDAPAIISDVTCPQLTVPTGSSVSVLPLQSVFRAGETARFSCDSGYILQGSNVLTCGADGGWSSPAVPDCVVMECGNPPDVENASWLFNGVGRSVGGSAVYECDEGFTSSLEHPALTCTETFEWSGDEISCVEGNGGDGNEVTSGPVLPPNDGTGNNETSSSVPALVWILIVIVIICLIIFLAGCIILRTGSSSGPRDYKQRDPLITDGVVVTREGNKMPHHNGAPLTTGTAFIGPAGSAVPHNDPEIGIPAENYSSRATSVASGTLRGNQALDLTETDADRYIDSLFDMDGFDGDNNNANNDVVGPYHPTMGGFGRGPSPHHHPEDDDYPPPPPEAHQYHDLERQRLDTPPQQAIYADTPGGSMDLPAHAGPSGSGSRNMYLPPAHDYPSVSNPNNSPSPVPSEDKSFQHPEKDFLDEVDEFFDGVNNKIDSCMMQ